MRNHVPTGRVLIWAMTFVRAPSIEGARSYPDVFPMTVAERIEDWRLWARRDEIAAQLPTGTYG